MAIFNSYFDITRGYPRSHPFFSGKKPAPRWHRHSAGKDHPSAGRRGDFDNKPGLWCTGNGPFRGEFRWLLLMFMDVCWCLLMFMDVYWCLFTCSMVIFSDLLWNMDGYIWPMDTRMMKPRMVNFWDLGNNELWYPAHWTWSHGHWNSWLIPIKKCWFSIVMWLFTSIRKKNGHIISKSSA